MSLQLIIHSQMSGKPIPSQDLGLVLKRNLGVAKSIKQEKKDPNKIITSRNVQIASIGKTRCLNMSRRSRNMCLMTYRNSNKSK